MDQKTLLLAMLIAMLSAMLAVLTHVISHATNGLSSSIFEYKLVTTQLEPRTEKLSSRKEKRFEI
jgi:hypothetical protein